MSTSGVPTVSVVIATYNFAHFLPQAIDSVLAQDYPADAIEIVVVDDGSTDSTPRVMRAYEDRVRYIRKRNEGHLATFSRGIGEATGDYIALLDGDDMWRPHKLRTQVGMLEADPGLGLVHGDMRIVDEHGKVLGDSFFAASNLRAVEGDLLAQLMRFNTITTSAILVRASLKEHFHPIPDWARVQDWWISLRVAEVARIGCVRDPVTDYRRHSTNLNHGRNHGRRHAKLLRAELPLRRRMMSSDTTLARLTGAEALAAFATFEKSVEGAAAGLEVPKKKLLAVERADKADAAIRLAAARAELAAGDADAAAREYVAALAHNPRCADAREELLGLAARAGWLGGALAPAPPVEPRPPAGVEGARSFTTLADGAELVARPELLRSYGETFGATDDATLVIRVDPERELEALAHAVAAVGMEGDDSADLMVVPRTQPAADLAGRVDAVLGGTLPEGPLAALPAIDADGVGALRRLSRSAAGTPVDGPSFAINICAPHWGVARSWGDLHFARAIQQELHRRGAPAAIHVINEWNRSQLDRYDVVLHLKGLTPYTPAPGQLNLLWNISHPEKLSLAECAHYDMVLIASETFAARLAERCPVPVAVLEQATDPAVFYPDPDPALAHELLFVGNSRRVMRPIVRDLLPTERDLAIWGGDWESLIGTEHLAGAYLPNDRVRGAYSAAGIVLNDHWADMREHGFISNRLYDAAACGALVISDRMPGLEERFGGAVVTYEGRDELHALVERFLADPAERARRGAAGRAAVLAQHTFAHRVDALLAHVEALTGARALAA
jgi:hypothetical protein